MTKPRTGLPYAAYLAQCPACGFESQAGFEWPRTVLEVLTHAGAAHCDDDIDGLTEMELTAEKRGVLRSLSAQLLTNAYRFPPPLAFKGEARYLSRSWRVPIQCCQLPPRLWEWQAWEVYECQEVLHSGEHGRFSMLPSFHLSANREVMFSHAKGLGERWVGEEEWRVW